MESKVPFLTPKKRQNESSDIGRLIKRTPDSGRVISSRDVVSGSRRDYKLKILLPNGVTVPVKIPDGKEFVTVKELAGRVKQQYDRAIQAKKASNPRKSVQWDAELSFIDDDDNVFKKGFKLTEFELNKVYNLRLHDGSQPATMYENMWDLTPDTELLMELPEEYTFETALADLIDNSLQAVWNNGSEKKLIRVVVTNDKISIIDTGPGMDDTTIENWGKMGASLHRAYKKQAIGGKPPYLKPAFGMFGYGGSIASMHLGRHTKVSSKTKNCKKVYMLHLKRDDLVSGAGSKGTWRTFGGLRDPNSYEVELSPGGSFTKVVVFEPKMRNVNIRRLQCKLKDIYFPYIQSDDLSKVGRTTRPIEFQVNGDDLAEIPGGEVAITNLNSCNGPEFVLQIRFHLNHENANTTSSPGARSSNEANARLRCVYLPVNGGKESIASVLETLKDDGYDYKEEFASFSHVSCRRLGRLLPDARWAWLPFMDFRQRKGDKTQVLKRSCMRVKCFIETDAGFSPTPSKTDFAHQNPFTIALKNLGSKQPLDKETGVEIDIRKDDKSLTLSQLDKQYQQWLLEMHEKYDEEVDSGVDEPVFIIVDLLTKKKLHISNNVVRVHKALRRKGKSWKSGQKIKILKGACVGFHKNNVYATLEFILLEGFQHDIGGDAWIICRPIDVPEQDGCLLQTVDGNTNFELKKSVSIPINVIDSGKCVAVDDTEWNNQINKQYQKCPSLIEMLNSRQCSELGIGALLPDEPEICAQDISPCEIVAVVRPATYKPGSPSKQLDQKYMMKDNFEMLLSVTFSINKKSEDENIYSGRVTPSLRNDFHGLYVFQPKCKSNPLFQRAGIYTFTFSIKDSSCKKCVVKKQVKASREVHKWALNKKISHNLRVGCSCEPISLSMFDKFENQIQFLKVPELVIKIKQTKGCTFLINKWNPSTSSDKLVLILEDLVVESSNLDKIRSNYDVTLMLSLHDGSHLLNIPVKVLPGPVRHFTVQQENFVAQLIPGHAIKELTLELFDTYGNHVEENEKVELLLDGFGWLDGSSSNIKVDANGCTDLSGIIKVTAGYGKNVSLSICLNGEVIDCKKWGIEKRQLRISSMMPERCFAGCQLENLEFEVVDYNGDVDINFHDEDKIGQSHTLMIKSSGFMDIDESVKYVFRQGRCIIRALSVPCQIGEFSFVVFHSRYPDIQLAVKIVVEQPEMEALNMSPLENTEFDYRNVQHHTPDVNSSSLFDDNNANLLQTDLESWLEYQKDFENEIRGLGLIIANHETNMKLLEYQINEMESKLSNLEVCRDQTRYIYKYGSPGKNEIKERVECKSDSAASLVMTIFRELSEKDRYGLMGNIIGVVALLATTPTFELSRIFAEYLGDKMLALVCKSSEDVLLLETYKKDGRLNHAKSLPMFAKELRGQPINGRYYVLCIEDIRACEADKDLDGKLLLPDPALPNGSTPSGFLGYAVNMINIDADHLEIKTNSGFGLRETLFYSLFGETQVYKTRQDMKRAVCCIKDSAVSLDGGIIIGNGTIFLGCWEPDIIFPVAVQVPCEDDNGMQMMRCHSELILKLKEAKEVLCEERKCHATAKEEFYKKLGKFRKYFTRNQSVSGSSQVSPMACLEEKPFVMTQGSYIPTQTSQ